MTNIVKEINFPNRYINNQTTYGVRKTEHCLKQRETAEIAQTQMGDNRGK